MNHSTLSSFCRNCGENIRDEIAFCRSCGTALSEDQVKANLRHAKEIARQKDLQIVPKGVAGTVIVGVLGVAFCLAVFVAAFFVGISFLPVVEHRGGSWALYLIVMGTIGIAGLSALSFVAQKVRARYPKETTRLLHLLNLQESR